MSARMAPGHAIARAGVKVPSRANAKPRPAPSGLSNRSLAAALGRPPSPDAHPVLVQRSADGGPIVIQRQGPHAAPTANLRSVARLEDLFRRRRADTSAPLLAEIERRLDLKVEWGAYDHLRYFKGLLDVSRDPQVAALIDARLARSGAGRPAAAIDRPVSLRSLIGQPGYYRARHDDFVRRTAGAAVAPPDYYLAYGEKYLRRFRYGVRPRLSPRGREWLDRTLILLQTYIEDRRDRDPRAFASLERRSDDFRDFAYSTHSTAYVEAGVCELPETDQLRILQEPDINDVVTLGGVRQIAEALGMCLVIWGAPQGMTPFGLRPLGMTE